MTPHEREPDHSSNPGCGGNVSDQMQELLVLGHRLGLDGDIRAGRANVPECALDLDGAADDGVDAGLEGLQAAEECI